MTFWKLPNTCVVHGKLLIPYSNMLLPSLSVPEVALLTVLVPAQCNMMNSWSEHFRTINYPSFGKCMRVLLKLTRILKYERTFGLKGDEQINMYEFIHLGHMCQPRF